MNCLCPPWKITAPNCLTCVCSALNVLLELLEVWECKWATNKKFWVHQEETYNAKAEGVHLDRDVSPEGLWSHVGWGAKHSGGLDERCCVGAPTPHAHQPKVTNLAKRITVVLHLHKFNSSIFFVSSFPWHFIRISNRVLSNLFNRPPACYVDGRQTWQD